MKHLAAAEPAPQEPPRLVPVFPLPDHVFLPDLPTPYRVFEPRYRQLVEDLLELPEQQRWVAIPRLAPGEAPDGEGAPGFEPVATVGRLIGATPTEEGEYLVVVRGLLRARLREIPSERLYRMATVEPWADVGVVEDPVARASYSTVVQLFAALRPYVDDEEIDAIGEALEDAPDLSTSVYRLGSVFVPDPDTRQQLLESRQPLERAAVVEDALATVLAAARGKATVSDAPC